MLDNPEKTTKLLAALKAAVPFEVELTEQVVEHLRAHGEAVADKKLHTVASLSYAGDEGGIICHMTEVVLPPSLMSGCHVPCRLRRPLPTIRSIA